ncbi:hypothetical protein ACFOJE_11805 [Azotobacter bryophylli]|uniref:DUF983 domain-containing protein n=1 Tax=Azotobacter bryophylli TaxID=1986537 RepID=A0ABV7AU45_9GAMM
MDSHCPSCRIELKGRYLGGLHIRCPNCQATLRYNIHPSEGGPWHFELWLYAIGFLALLIAVFCVAVFKVPLLIAAIAFAAPVCVYIWSALRKAGKAIPESWPRWVVMSPGRKPRP